MPFFDFEEVKITTSGLAYICLGGFIVSFSMVSLFIKEKLYINEVFLGTAFGVIMGPHCTNLFDPRSWGSSTESTNTITLEVMRVVLATSLFLIGIELPKNYMYKHMKSLLIMVVPTMAFGWLVIAGFLKLLFRSLGFKECLIISACLTPTDPVICAAIVGGKFAMRYVPVNIRHILSAESAANDGLAYPFLTIALYLTIERSTAVAVEKWVLIGCLYQVVLGIVLGSVLGFLFSFLMKLSHKKGLINKEAYLAQQVAFALLTTGLASTIGSDDLLAAFAAGSTISWDGEFNTHVENEVFTSIVDFALNCICFIYIGAWIPFESFASPQLGLDFWRLLVLFLAVLALRRIPALLLLFTWVPEISNWKEALFCGHFGPMGVGAIFVSSLAIEKINQAPDTHSPQVQYLIQSLQPIVSFIVLGSIITHGLSVVLLSSIIGLRARTRTLVEHNRPLSGLNMDISLPAPVQSSARRRTPSKMAKTAECIRTSLETIPKPGPSEPQETEIQRQTESQRQSAESDVDIGQVSRTPVTNTRESE